MSTVFSRPLFIFRHNTPKGKFGFSPQPSDRREDRPKNKRHLNYSATEPTKITATHFTALARVALGETVLSDLIRAHAVMMVDLRLLSKPTSTFA